MARYIVVPDTLREDLLSHVDKAIDDLADEKHREEARDHRDELYNQLLAHYQDRGSVPTFHIQRLEE